MANSIYIMSLKRNGRESVLMQVLVNSREEAFNKFKSLVDYQLMMNDTFSMIEWSLTTQNELNFWELRPNWRYLTEEGGITATLHSFNLFHRSLTGIYTVIEHISRSTPTISWSDSIYPLQEYKCPNCGNSSYLELKNNYWRCYTCSNPSIGDSGFLMQPSINGEII